MVMNETIGNSRIFEHVDEVFTRKGPAAYAILVTEVFLCFFGNSLFLMTVRRIRIDLSNMYIIMSSLSMTDIIGGLSFFDTIIRDFIIKDYRIQCETCKWALFFSISAISSNAWHVVLMSADRYIAVAYAHR